MTMPTPLSKTPSFDDDAWAAVQLICGCLAVLCLFMCALHLLTSPMPEKTVSAGANQPPISKAHIEAHARQAAAAGTSLRDGCPYPLNTPAGQHWAAHWAMAQGDKK